MRTVVPDKEMYALWGSVANVKPPEPGALEADVWARFGDGLPPGACPDAGRGEEETSAARTKRPMPRDRIMR